MSQNLDNHVSLLRKEIYDFTKNINNIENKNHTTVNNIVKKLKNYNTDLIQKNFPLNNNTNNTNLYTEQNKPNIKSLKQNYRKKNNFNCYRNKNTNYYFQNGSNSTNSNTNNPVLTTQTNDSKNNNKKYIISSSMFQNYSHRTNYTNLKKDKSKNLKRNCKSREILNTDINLNQRQIISRNINEFNLYDEYPENKGKLLYKRYKNSNSTNKDVYIKKNNVRNNKIENMKNNLKNNNNETYINKFGTVDQCFSFIEKIQNIYNKNNNNSDNINRGDLNNILKWVIHLTHENKYEKFCLDIMKENNIKNFNDFKIKIYDLMDSHKKENCFLNDIKKILCSDNDNEYTKKSKKRCKTVDRMTIENFDDIVFHE